MQPAVQAWLLQPGDPLPPLAVDRRLLSPPAGQWWLLALSPDTDCDVSQVKAKVGELAALSCVGAGQDRDGSVARALGVWGGRDALPCCVVTEPGGSVAGSWTGDSLSAALEQAVTALRDWRAK